MLAVIDPRPYEVALSRPPGPGDGTRAQLENARLNLSVFAPCWPGSIARQDVDTQAALVSSSRAPSRDRAAESTRRASNLGYSRIVAPVAGRVGLRQVDPGNYVLGGRRDRRRRDHAGDADRRRIRVPQDRVPEIQARLAEGARLAGQGLDRDADPHARRGLVLHAGQPDRQQTGTVKAKARFANADQALFPNQFVNVQLLLERARRDVVPVGPVHRGTDGDFVYLLQDDAR